MIRIVTPMVTGRHQRGAATLLIALVVLTTITFISFYTARTVMTEQKVSSNVLRSRMAFEAAEAGAESAMAYLGDGRDRDGDGKLPGVLAGSDDDEFLFDSDGNPADNESNTLVLDDGSRVTVSLVNQDFTTASGINVIATEIQAQGWSDDQAATRTVIQTVALVSPLPNGPQNPLITRGSVVVNGASTVINPEGNSTIWSGDDVDLTANNSTHTEVANPADANYPDCLGDADNPCGTIQGSDRYVAGLDIIEYDTSLKNLSKAEFFENFFGVPPAKYRATRVTMDIDVGAGDDLNQIKLATREVIWVDGDIDGFNGTVGCRVAVVGAGTCSGDDRQPSILIVDGDLDLNGTPHFYGLVYVTGDILGSGNATFHGSLVTEGDATATNGSLAIRYNSTLLEMLAESGGQIAGGGGGSWRDF